MKLTILVSTIVLLAVTGTSAFTLPKLVSDSIVSQVVNHQTPAAPKGVKTILTPQNVTIRYKEPGVCETTRGVNSYAGYIDLDVSFQTC